MLQVGLFVSIIPLKHFSRLFEFAPFKSDSMRAYPSPKRDGKPLNVLLIEYRVVENVRGIMAKVITDTRNESLIFLNFFSTKT